MMKRINYIFGNRGAKAKSICLETTGSEKDRERSIRRNGAVAGKLSALGYSRTGCALSPYWWRSYCFMNVDLMEQW